MKLNKQDYISKRKKRKKHLAVDYLDRRPQVNLGDFECGATCKQMLSALSPASALEPMSAW